MRRCVTIVAVVALTSCASNNPMSMVSQLSSNPMIAALTSSLGLSAQQAVGGAGALLGLGKNTLDAANWSKLAGAIPGVDDMIKAGNALGGITGKVGGLADLSGAFSKIGLSKDQVTALVPAVTDYVGKAAGPDVGAALAAVLK